MSKSRQYLDKIKTFLDSSYRWLFVVASFWLLLPLYFFQPIEKRGRDSHWKTALHHALDNGLSFGQDIVFTYGPFGILHSRYAFQSITWHLMVWDFISYSLIAYGLYVVARRLVGLGQFLGGFFLIFITASFGTPLDAPFLLFALFCFYCFLFLESRNIVFLLIASLLSLISFYCKISSGIVVFSLQWVIFLEYLLFGKNYKHAFGVILIYLAFFLLVLVVFNVEVFGYVKGGLQFIASYTEAMYQRVGQNYSQLCSALTLFIFAAYACLRNPRDVLLNKNQFLIVVFTAAFAGILFKQGFTRGDWFHVTQFFQFAPLCLGVWYVFASESMKRDLSICLISCMIFSYSYKSLSYDYRAFEKSFDGAVGYFSTLFDKNLEPKPKMFKAVHKLPDKMKAEIADTTVDIFPYQIYHLILDGYNYQPRPVLQTYASYNKYLDDLNAKHFASEKAPEFVLFSYGAIDLRYDFFDEPQTRLELLRSYEVAQAEGFWVLLRKRAERLPLTQIPLEGPTGFELGNAIPIPPTDGLIYLTVDCHYTRLGKLARMFYKPPRLRVELNLPNGDKRTHRAVKPQLESGVLVSPFVGSIFDTAHFFNRARSRLSAVSNVRFFTDDPWGFEPGCGLSWKEVAGSSIAVSVDSLNDVEIQTEQ